MFSISLPVMTAGYVNFCPDPTQLVSALGAVRPTAFFGVPRVWEKVQAGIQALLTGEQDSGRRAAVQEAMGVGRRYVEGGQFGRTTPPELDRPFRPADEQVLAPLPSPLGLAEAAPASHP